MNLIQYFFLQFKTEIIYILISGALSQGFILYRTYYIDKYKSNISSLIYIYRKINKFSFKMLFYRDLINQIERRLID